MTCVKSEKDVQRIAGEIFSHLGAEGIRGKLVPAGHMSDLQGELNTYRASGLLDATFDGERLSGFDYSLGKQASGGSLFILAAPQPQTLVTFTYAGRSYRPIIPPTYLHAIDATIRSILQDHLTTKGYHVYEPRLPKKLLATRSGLAVYGKNNLAYIPGLGSFFRLCVFGSDLPTIEDPWRERELLSRCETCQACLKACPTDAIRGERFVIQAERCLTYFNERTTDFPSWFEPDWHNCLVGCMVCQWICPENREYRGWLNEGRTFTEEETLEILEGTSPAEMAASTTEKLRSMDLLEYLEQLPRNMRALIGQESTLLAVAAHGIANPPVPEEPMEGGTSC